MTIGNRRLVNIKSEHLADAIEDALKRVHKNSKVVYLDSNTGSDSYNGLRMASPFATLSAAHGALTASQGDTIIVLPNHAETISAAAGVDLSKANIRVIGLNVGGQKPTFTFGTVTGASIDVTGNGIEIKGIIGLAGLDGLTKPFNVTGNDCKIDIEWRDASSTVEAETAVRLDTADNCNLKLLYRGFTAGNAVVRAVAIDDCDNVSIEMDAYGVVSTAWINLVDAASTNVSIKESSRFYTSGITNFTRNVVDTVGGSTWDARFFDSSFGGWISGGSAAALASDDVSAIGTLLTGATGSAAIHALALQIDQNLTGAAGVVTWSAGAAAANGVSIHEALRYAQEGIRQDGGTAMGAAKSVADALGTNGLVVADSAVSVLGAIGADNANNAFSSASVTSNPTGSVLERQQWTQAQIGTLTNTAGTATLGGIIGDVANSSIAARLTYCQDALGGSAGIATFPSAAAAANNVSIAEVIRQIQNTNAFNAMDRNSDNYFAVTADMTSATWNTQTTHEIATVTGLVRMKILPECTSTLTDAADGASIQLGHETVTNAFIASTQCAGAGGNTIETGEIWIDASPADVNAAASTAIDQFVVNGRDVGYEITGAALTGGTLVFHCWWVPISSTGAVVAGVGGAL